MCGQSPKTETNSENHLGRQSVRANALRSDRNPVKQPLQVPSDSRRAAAWADRQRSQTKSPLRPFFADALYGFAKYSSV
jgi:hypothetical protein